MADKTSQTKRKRPSKSERIHIRRVKQAARKGSTDTREPASAPRP